VHFATNVVDSLGLVGIFVLMLAESACIPIPSEATMLFAGFGVSHGRFSLLAITIAGVAGNLVGSWLAYGLGYFGRMELVDRHAHKLHIKQSHVAWADRWFSRYGEATVLFTRMLPIIRTFISLPAGVARMPFFRFTVFTLLGCLPWVFLLAFAGEQVGHNWTQWKDSLRYVDYGVIVAVGFAVAYLIARRLTKRRASSRPPAGSPSRSDHRQVPAAEHDGADAEHKSGLGRQQGDPAIASSLPVERVDGERRCDAAEVPRQTEEQRDQPEKNAERAEQAGQGRAVSIQEGHPDPE
jgi:membrane protein DedA with SNARE-associated domain